MTRTATLPLKFCNVYGNVCDEFWLLLQSLPRRNRGQHDRRFLDFGSWITDFAKIWEVKVKDLSNNTVEPFETKWPGYGDAGGLSRSNSENREHELPNSRTRKGEA
jgi:hypothetical protein